MDKLGKGGDKKSIGGQSYPSHKPFDPFKKAAEIAEGQGKKDVAPSSSDTLANKGGLTTLSNDSGYWSEEEYSHKKVPNGELHGSASQALTESISSDDGKVYEKLGYKVPKGREGMEEMTVGEYLEKRGSSSLPKGREWMLDRKLGDFQEFWENKPLDLEFGKFVEVRSQTSKGGKGADSRGVFEYSGRFGEAELGIGEKDPKWEPWKVPKFIGDKRVVDVSGKGNDCLLRSLGVAAGVKDLGGFVEKGRQYLVEKRLTKPGKELDLGTSQGVEFVEYLREANLLRSDCAIRLHTYSPEGKLRYRDVIPGFKERRPYEIFLMNGHFQALVDTGNSSHEHIEVPIRETSEVNSSAKRELRELLTAPEGGSLADVGRESSKMRFLDLVDKMAPAGDRENVKEAVEQYCEKFKVGAQHLNRIISALEENPDAANEFLSENRNNIEAFTARLGGQKPKEQELISPYADAKTQLDLERPRYGTAAGEA